jgi:hypothetical protein
MLAGMAAVDDPHPQTWYSTHLVGCAIEREIGGDFDVELAHA